MKLLPPLKRLDARGISHVILPLVVMVGVATFGVYKLVASHADSLGDRLSAGQTLQSGKSLVSQDKGMKLAMQTDGNLVLYNRADKAVWSSRTYNHVGYNATMQRDGNFVIYNKAGKAVWASNTSGRGASLLILQNDANLVLYTAKGVGVWATYTYGQMGTASKPTPTPIPSKPVPNPNPNPTPVPTPTPTPPPMPGNSKGWTMISTPYASTPDTPVFSACMISQTDMVITMKVRADRPNTNMVSQSVLWSADSRYSGLTSTVYGTRWSDNTSIVEATIPKADYWSLSWQTGKVGYGYTGDATKVPTDIIPCS